ncbi:MAG: hypothetical protein WEB30_03390 [Cyclobacteriaceae bacterium]
MKKIFCALALLFSVATGFSQTMYIANSNTGATGGTNVFTGANSINVAITAAAAGDIIYVVPSSVLYTDPIIDKSVSLIGGGYNPDKPGSSVSSMSSLSINTNDVRISGLVMINYVTHQGLLSNIMIDNCRARRVIVPNANTVGNMIVQNCIIGENETNAPFFLQTASSNITLSNNIIYHADGTGAAIQGLNGGTVENNVFIAYASPGTATAFQDVTLSNIQNNIFLGVAPVGLGTFSNNVQQNNLSFSTSNDVFSTLNGNTSVNNKEGLSPLFANVLLGTSFSFSYDLTLQAGSPAIGAGVGGTDMGVFGGLNPYDIYGTSLPIVRTITAPNTVSQGSNMDVRVEAKGN